MTNKGHGEARVRTPEYNAWANIKSRCYNPAYAGYGRYGGRGIRLCDKWRNDYSAFLAYVGRKPGPGYQIDRWPDNDGNYEPGNVRWATRSQNTRNRRSGRFVEFNGEVRCIAEWSDITGIKYHTLHQRISRGCNIQQIFAEGGLAIHHE